jgi:ribosomal protein S7
MSHDMSDVNDDDLLQALKELAEKQDIVKPMANKILKQSKRVTCNKMSAKALESSQKFYAQYLSVAVLNEVLEQLGLVKTKL